jgi:hypothetical protein
MMSICILEEFSMASQPFSSEQLAVQEESAEIERGGENTRVSTIWKIVAAVVTALFVMLLLWVGSRLVWLGAG